MLELPAHASATLTLQFRSATLGKTVERGLTVQRLSSKTLDNLTTRLLRELNEEYLVSDFQPFSQS